MGTFWGRGIFEISQAGRLFWLRWQVFLQVWRNKSNCQNKKILEQLPTFKEWYKWFWFNINWNCTYAFVFWTNCVLQHTRSHIMFCQRGRKLIPIWRTKPSRVWNYTYLYTIFRISEILVLISRFVRKTLKNSQDFLSI